MHPAKSYGTCGHDLARGHENLALRAVDHDLDNDCLVQVVSHVMYCKACARRMRKIRMVLENEAEEHAWVTLPMC